MDSSTFNFFEEQVQHLDQVYSSAQIDDFLLSTSHIDYILRNKNKVRSPLRL